RTMTERSHTLVFVGLLLTGAVSAGCHRMGCPSDMDPIASKSTKGKVTLCGSADGVYNRWIEFYPGTEQPRFVCSFSRGKPEAFRAYFPDGERWVQGGYTHGVIDGL